MNCVLSSKNTTNWAFENEETILSIKPEINEKMDANVKNWTQ